METPIKVLIVDDHPLIRSGLTAALESEISVRVIGESGDGLEAVENALRLKPDVILMDIIMPRLRGLEAMVKIKESLPNVQVLMLTVCDHEQDLFEAVRLGARGYLLKSATITEIIEAVRKTAKGEVMLSPAMSEKLLTWRQGQHDVENSLSSREIEVLRLLGKGFSNPEIAASLFISVSTVRTHLQNILENYHMRNRAEAITYSNRYYIN